MSGRLSNRGTRRRRRGGLVPVLGVAALVAGLVYWGQVEIIYVLSVLGLCAFLVVVAFSDLDRGTRQAGAGVAEADEAAPAAGGTTAVAAATVAASTPAPVRRRAAQGRQRGAA